MNDVLTNENENENVYLILLEILCIRLLNNLLRKEGHSIVYILQKLYFSDSIYVSLFYYTTKNNILQKR